MQGRLFDLIQMLIDAVHRSKLPDQLGRRLLSHLGNTGNIVGSVSHQSLYLNKLQRSDPVGLQDLRLPEIIDHRLPLAGAGDPDTDPVRRDL